MYILGKKKSISLADIKCRIHLQTLFFGQFHSHSYLLIQGRHERKETNLIHYKWGSVWIVTSLHFSAEACIFIF